MFESFDIFISYRRKGGFDTAKHLYDLLIRDGYTVSFDIDTLRNGDFDKTLLQRIDICKDFILIINKEVFDRLNDPDYDPGQDWLRQELAYALKKGKNVIPIFLQGVEGFPKNLPSDIIAVTKKNGPTHNHEYFNEFYKKLKNRFLISERFSGMKNARMIIYLNEAEKGNVNAMLRCGEIFFKGSDVSVDYSLALKWFLKAAEQGNNTAQFYIGKIYEEGLGIPVNIKEAEGWYRLSADMGNQEAKHALLLLDGKIKQNECIIREKQDNNNPSITNNVIPEVSENNIKILDSKKNLQTSESLKNNTPSKIVYSKDKAKTAYDNEDYYNAFKYYSIAAELGDAEAQNKIGEMYYDGEGVDVNNVEAMKWYRLAAHQGNAKAMCNIGEAYEVGICVEKNYSEALKWYNNAANKLGNVEALVEIGDMYFDGKGVKKNQDEALRLYKMAAEKGNGEGLYRLGSRYLFGDGVAQSYDKAIKWFENASNYGYVPAQNAIGRIYYTELKNTKKALEWLKKAALQNNNIFESLCACQSIGNIYFEGKGIEKNYSEALKWYKKVVEVDKRWTFAVNMIGFMYHKGLGVDQNYREAFKWFKIAADQGYASAQNSLGILYFYGCGVNKNYNEALRWFRLAAKQDNIEAQFNIGWLYEFGYGVNKNYYEAKRWYNLSAKQGHKQAEQALQRLMGVTKKIIVSPSTLRSQAQTAYNNKDYKLAYKLYLKLSEFGDSEAENYLGKMFLWGDGVETNYSDAKKWFEKAAYRSNADAQYNLGSLYDYGLGVKRDVLTAIKWYKLAADKGHKYAIKELNKHRPKKH